MEFLSPKTRVPHTWVHPDLKRQMAERRNNPDLFSCRIDVLETQRDKMAHTESHLQQEIENKRARLEELDRHRAEIAAEIDGAKNRLVELRYVGERLYEQILLQRVTVQQTVSDTLEGVGYFQPNCSAISVGSASIWGELRPCFRLDNETRVLFFRQYASFFLVAEGKTSAVRKVTETAFLNEMCLMETESCCCKNSACLYWHFDQLAHVSRGFKNFIACALTRVEGHPKICDVANRFACLHEEMSAATELVDAVRIYRDALNSVATLGWGEIFLTGEKKTIWSAPLLPPRPQKFGMSITDVHSLLRDLGEQNIWQDILHSNSNAIHTATALFQKRSDSLSWRCLMRVAGTNTERILWLATRGVALFPTSPSIRLSYVLALLKSGCSASDCVSACVQSAKVLSVHAAKLTLSQVDLQWSETASRYIAYMIAKTCVSLAPADPNAAKELLEWALQVPGRLCLLPLAFQNLTLLLVLLRQTKDLGEVDALPLASISDVAFSVSECFPGRPRDECGQLLSRQLDLLMRCAAAGIDTELTEFMRSAIHISLMHMFSGDPQLVDQVVAKSQINSFRGSTALWREYLHFVERRDGTSSFIALLQSLSEQCQFPLLMVCIVRLFDFYGEDVKTVTASFVQRFAVNRGILLDSVCQLATEEMIGISADEWIPFLILYSYCFDQRERLEFLLGIPISSYCQTLELVFMLWLEMIQSAVSLGDKDIFRHCFRHGLQLLSEPFFYSFSSIDCYFEEMISFAHTASLMIYRAVPVLLGKSCALTDCYRRIVLEVSEKLHVVHPYLFAEK